jgi:phosphoadenosine phosphosulfate reductase
VRDFEEKLSTAKETLDWAISRFERIALACSFGKDSVTVLSLAREIDPEIKVFMIRTGYGFKETEEFKNWLGEEWNLNLEEIHPTTSKNELEKEHGKDLYSRDPKLCCEILKVEPTRRYLRSQDAWITGLRSDETEFRVDLARVEEYEGMPTKINPIADWTNQEVWGFIRSTGIPYNPLYDKGFASLGCKPCTLAGTWGRYERAGRWPGKEKKECGMHLLDSEDNE